jgi:hypothetical protein
MGTDSSKQAHALDDSDSNEAQIAPSEIPGKLLSASSLPCDVCEQVSALLYKL